MREIKFRGFSEKENRWVYGCFVRYSENVSYIYEDLLIEDGIEEVVAKTVGQYTGLKDSEGLEIYEGDVYIYNGEKGVIIFEESMYKCRVGIGDSMSQSAPIFYLYSDIEITGNIHEQ